MSAGRVQVQGRAGPGGVSGALLDGKGGAALLMVSLTPSATAVPHGMDVRLLRPQTVGKHGGLAFPDNQRVRCVCSTSRERQETETER